MLYSLLTCFFKVNTLSAFCSWTSRSFHNVVPICVVEKSLKSTRHSHNFNGKFEINQDGSHTMEHYVPTRLSYNSEVVYGSSLALQTVLPDCRKETRLYTDLTQV